MCTICLETKPKILMCECSNITCLDCQHMLKHLKCASCDKQYTITYLESVSAKLLKTLVRPYEEDIFWEREKGLIPATQILLEWETLVASLNKQKRFGFHVILPQTPTMTISSNEMFPCPSIECRGFVSSNKCGTCKAEICKECREPMSLSHKCNLENIESIKAIQKDSKPCPSCGASIFKIQGCNHMFCTNCRTHFEWETKKILKTSTNHHYLNTQPFQRSVAPEGKDNQMIHAYLHERLDRVDLANNHYEALIRVRLNFLKGVEEKTCKQKVWILEKAYECRLQESAILETYLQKFDVEKANSELIQAKSSIRLVKDSGPLLKL